jgi:hypothetical protein
VRQPRNYCSTLSTLLVFRARRLKSRNHAGQAFECLLAGKSLWEVPVVSSNRCSFTAPLVLRQSTNMVSHSSIVVLSNIPSRNSALEDRCCKQLVDVCDAIYETDFWGSLTAWTQTFAAFSTTPAMNGRSSSPSAGSRIGGCRNAAIQPIAFENSKAIRCFPAKFKHVMACLGAWLSC